MSNPTAFVTAVKNIEQESVTLTWPIPAGCDKNRGDLGLLPEDEHIATWHIPPTSASFLRFIILASNAKLILELGASVGYSTAWLGLAASETDGHVHSTEIFPEKSQLARENLIRAGVSEHVTLHEEDILAFLTRWSTETPFDFVFMDADKQRYAAYLESLWPLLRNGAVIVVDNVGNYPEYMADFLKAVLSLEGSAVHFLDIDNGLLLIVKNRGANLLPFFPEQLPDAFKENINVGRVQK